jgi:hypothetical protein
MKRNLRRALDKIQDMLDGKSYSAELWDVLVALRGPDSRDRKIKNATTTIIRTAAFPKRPCQRRSVFADRDSEKLAARRSSLFATKLDNNHFREHVRDAFAALGLKLEETNGNLTATMGTSPSRARKRSRGQVSKQP